MLAKFVRSASLSLSVALCLLFGSVVARASTAAAARGLPGIHSSFRSSAAVAPSYTIDDIGAPPGYASTEPLSFNNTGQIFGLAYNGYSALQCYVWTGTSFIRIPLAIGASNTNCFAEGMNDADRATGEYEVVGGTEQPFAFGERAFSSIVGPKGVKRTTIYFGYNSSVMIGVSGNGTALATAELDRDTPLDTQGPHYFTAAVGVDSLTLLQALPAVNGPPVRVLGPTNLYGQCPFGGCLINDHHIVLGYDNSTFDKLTSIGTDEVDAKATAAYATVGQPYALTHLPFTDFVGQDGFSNVETRDAPLALNNLDQLVHYDEALHVTSVYDIDTSILTILPVSPPSCVDPQPKPLSMNNREEVLMVVTNCHRYTGYYTWDPIDGTQYLDERLPVTDKTVYPLGVNDSGQILVELTSTAGVVTWGTLNPVASATRKLHR